jgi:hypothetical protein
VQEAPVTTTTLFFSVWKGLGSTWIEDPSETAPSSGQFDEFETYEHTQGFDVDVAEIPYLR